MSRPSLLMQALRGTQAVVGVYPADLALPMAGGYLSHRPSVCLDRMRGYRRTCVPDKLSSRLEHRLTDGLRGGEEVRCVTVAPAALPGFGPGPGLRLIRCRVRVPV